MGKRATEAAKNASDKLYTKQRREVIDNYRGYQTMDSRVHPDVVRGQKASDLISDVVYKEDYNNSREVVVFPYTLTDHYDITQAMQKLKYDYVYEHEKNKAKNRFDVTDTPVYSQIKDHDKQTNDIKYKEDFENNRGQMIGATVTMDMERAKELAPIKKQLYENVAKANLVNTNIPADGQQIAHAIHMTNQASDIAYTADYKKDVLGKSTKDPAIAYPEHDRLKKIHDDTNKAHYVKEARKEMQKNMLPVDAPEFKRARETAKIASDKEYNKQRAQTVHDYRGYQTMDSRVHPDVVRGQKASDLISDKKYKLDYENDKDVVYFPYTITQEYDDKYNLKRHGEEYKHDYEKTKDKNHYDVTDTPVYGQIKDHNIQTNDLNYKQDFEKNKGKMLGTDVTPEMARAHEMEPIR